MKEIAFEAFGVRVLVSTDIRDAYERLGALLPPGAIECPPESIEYNLRLTRRPDGRFGVYLGEMPVLVGGDLGIAFELLDAQIRAHVALYAEDRIFVHAGVVGNGGGAIVIPGRSFSGKTTLVAELVRSGATYYSDEYAVLDYDGLVHPYPKPLSIRDEFAQQTDHPVAALGGIAGEDSLPIRTILVCDYRPGGEWHPTVLTSGQGVLAMLSNTVAARTKPEEALRAVTRAVEGATVLQGDRGEASSVVDQLLGPALA
jgi:hypothetical protein